MWWEDFAVGSASDVGTHTFTAEEIVAFGRQFDPQPYHSDPIAAKSSPFGGLIASGWHTVSLVMRVLVDHYLARGAALASPGVDELRWLQPVRPGDVLRVRATVVEARRSQSKPDRGLVRTKVEALNQNGQVVLSMVAMNLFRCRNPE
jgi:acyl dehydratase